MMQQWFPPNIRHRKDKHSLIRYAIAFSLAAMFLQCSKQQRWVVSFTGEMPCVNFTSKGPPECQSRWILWQPSKYFEHEVRTWTAEWIGARARQKPVWAEIRRMTALGCHKNPITLLAHLRRLARITGLATKLSISQRGWQSNAKCGQTGRVKVRKKHNRNLTV